MLIAAWIVAVVTSAGMAIVTSRGTSAADIDTPLFGGAPILVPVITFAVAVAHLAYALTSGTFGGPYAGLVYPIAWAAVTGGLWLLGALLTRSETDDAQDGAR